MIFHRLQVLPQKLELPQPAEPINPDLLKSFYELCKGVANLNLTPNWGISFGNTLHIFIKNEKHEISVSNVYFSINLIFLIRVFEWCLPADHFLYENITAPLKMLLCQNYGKEQQLIATREDKNDRVLHYCNKDVVCKKIDPFICPNRSVETKFEKFLSCAVFYSILHGLPKI